MPSKPKTVTEYLAALPKDRRDALQAVRKVIRANLDRGYREGIQYGMIGYFVPLSVYPAGYHCDASQPLPYMSLASQKNHMAVYLFCVYTSEEEQRWFREAWAKTGKKLDMGKSCVRFKKVDDLALDVIAKTIKRMPSKKYIAHYESVSGRAEGTESKWKITKKKTTKKKVAKKKLAKKAAARKKTTKKKVTRKKTRTTAKKTARPRAARKTTARKTTKRRTAR
jgi:hypothetical protein